MTVIPAHGIQVERTAPVKEVGIRLGAQVDIGWNGIIKETFEFATAALMKLKAFGYYFSWRIRQNAHDLKPARIWRPWSA